MIRLTKLVAENWCQFLGHHEWDLDGGMIGIFGPNGAGKSNLLALVRFLITGSSGNDGTMVDDITTGEERGAGELHFVADGLPGMVRRTLPSGGSTLKYGDETIKKTSLVKKKMLSFFGVDQPAMLAALMVQQGELTDIAFSDPSVREKRFHKLCGVDRIEAARAAVVAERAGLPGEVLIPDQTAAEKQLQDRMAELEESTRLEKELLAKKLTDQETVDFNDVIFHKKQWDDSKEALLAAERYRSRVETAAVAVRGEAASWLEQTAPDIQRMKELKKFVEPAMELLALYQVNTERATSRDSIVHECSAYQATMNKPVPENTVTDKYEQETRDWQGKYQSLLVEVANLNTFIKAFEGGTAVCPTCGTEMKNAQELVDKAKERLPKAIEEYHAILLLIEEFNSKKRSYAAARTTWQANFDSAKINLGRATARLSQLGEIHDVPKEAVDTAGKTVAEYNGLSKHLEGFEKKMRELETAVAKAEGAFQGAVDSVVRAKVVLNELGGSGDQAVVGARNALDNDRIVCSDLRLAMSTSANLKDKLIPEAEVAIEGVKKARVQNEKLQSYREFLNRVAGFMHREELQRMLVQAKRRQFSLTLNQFLEMFSLPFTMHVQDNMSMTAAFKDGEIRTARRLSIGQRTMLSVADIFAEAQLFCENAGVLFLDEPTAYLDTDNRAGMAELFKLVKAASDNTGRQVFLITHEDALKSATSKVINLEAV